MDSLLAEVTAAAAARPSSAAPSGAGEALAVPRPADSDADEDAGPAQLMPALPEVVMGSDLCDVCAIHFHKYTCPQCQMRYCSLQCYKSEAHADCSEGFYKAEVMSTLKSQVVDPAQREQMATMLRRAWHDRTNDNESGHADAAALAMGDDEDNGTPDLLQRLQGLDLDDETQTERILAALTPEERAQFADRAHLATLLVQWQPWWEAPTDRQDEAWGAPGKPGPATDGHPLVEVLGESNGGDGEAGAADTSQEDMGDAGDEETLPASARRDQADPPALAQGIPPLSQLLRGKQPAKELIFNMLDLVYCYTYTCRRYNGDVDHAWAECAEGLLAISPVLGDGVTHTSVDVALHTTMARLMGVDAMFVSSWASARTIKDLGAVLRSPDSVARALSHTHAMVARAVASKAPVVVNQAREARQRLKRAEKKLVFFVAWWMWLSGKDDADDGQLATRLLSAVSTEVEAVHTARVGELAAVESDRQAYQQAWNGPRPPQERSLIQEL
eukprot:m.23010 g.23010  ORF g.23010 m.23010 type:complete len:502 (+) comp4047_c0_seq2:93-1598(+)